MSSCLRTALQRCERSARCVTVHSVVGACSLLVTLLSPCCCAVSLLVCCLFLSHQRVVCGRHAVVAVSPMLAQATRLREDIDKVVMEAELERQRIAAEEAAAKAAAEAAGLGALGLGCVLGRGPGCTWLGCVWVGGVWRCVGDRNLLHTRATSCVELHSARTLSTLSFRAWVASQPGHEASTKQA